MNMRRTLYAVALLFVALAANACGSSPTPTPTPKPTVPPVPTLSPTAIPTPTETLVPPTLVPPTQTPIPITATAKQAVNVRQGPGVQFSVLGKLSKDDTAVVIGKSEDGKWLELAQPDADHPGWVSAAFVSVTGSIDQLPVVAVTPPPTNTPGGVAAATKTPAAPPTQVVPAFRGVLGFVTYETSSASYSLNNITVDSRAIAGFKLLGPAPFDIAHSTNAAPFAWAPDGSGRVAYVFGRLGGATTSPNGLHVVRGDVDQTLVSHQGISSPVWSPDGKTLAYIGMDNNYGTQFIYTIGPDGKENRLFGARTDKPESFRGLAWGKWILFVSNYTGYYEIWRLNPDGSGPMQLTNDKRENGSPAWSPDGSKFAYYSKQADGSYQIVVANADGTNPVKMTSTNNNFTPAWSPDGNWIAFASDRGGRMDVYVMNKYGGQVQVLTNKYPAQSLLPGSWR